MAATAANFLYSFAMTLLLPTLLEARAHGPEGHGGEEEEEEMPGMAGTPVVPAPGVPVGTRPRPSGVSAAPFTTSGVVYWPKARPYKKFKGPQNHMLFSTSHGIIMALAFAIVFPLGAVVLRLVKYRAIAWLHGIWQLAGLALVVVGLGLGITVGEEWVYAEDNPHAIIGLVACAVLLLQPVSGIIHHAIFKRKQAPTPIGFGHRWIGRAMLFLGIINGGLGLQLAGEKNAYVVAYGVVAAICGLAWVLAAFLNWRKKMTAPRGRAREKSPIGTEVPHYA